MKVDQSALLRSLKIREERVKELEEKVVKVQEDKVEKLKEVIVSQQSKCTETLVKGNTNTGVSNHKATIYLKQSDISNALNSAFLHSFTYINFSNQ